MNSTTRKLARTLEKATDKAIVLGRAYPIRAAIAEIQRRTHRTSEARRFLQSRMDYSATIAGALRANR